MTAESRQSVQTARHIQKSESIILRAVITGPDSFDLLQYARTMGCKASCCQKDLLRIRNAAEGGQRENRACNGRIAPKPRQRWRNPFRVPLDNSGPMFVGFLDQI